MSDPWADALPIFQKTMGVAIHYEAQDITALPLTAPKIDEPAADYEGFTGKARRVAFEITMPGPGREPDKGDIITEDLTGARWRVNDSSTRGAVNAWLVFVEEDDE